MYSRSLKIFDIANTSYTTYKLIKNDFLLFSCILNWNEGNKKIGNRKIAFVKLYN